MSLIASDFSFLPDVKVPGERAPLVSTKVCSFFPSNYALKPFSACVDCLITNHRDMAKVTSRYHCLEQQELWI